jgi:hypothetical protein
VKRLWLWLVLLVLVQGQAAAHELRPGYLEITETAPGLYSVLWKVPMRGEAGSRLAPRFPDECRETDPPVTSELWKSEILS